MLKLLLPKNIKISWGSDFIQVEGPLGALIKKRSNFSLAEKDGHLYLWTTAEFANQEGFYLAKIRSLIIGVTKGFRQRLKLVGVGFRGALINNKLSLKIGFSHEVLYEIPSDVEILVSKAKGSFVLIKGLEKERVQQVAKEIRKLREPDDYKGKGIHYHKETLKLKKGKKEGK